jgi:hypothetical protein
LRSRLVGYNEIIFYFLLAPNLTFLLYGKYLQPVININIAGEEINGVLLSVSEMGGDAGRDMVERNDIKKSTNWLDGLRNVIPPFRSLFECKRKTNI